MTIDPVMDLAIPGAAGRPAEWVWQDAWRVARAVQQVQTCGYWLAARDGTEYHRHDPGSPPLGVWRDCTRTGERAWLALVADQPVTRDGALLLFARARRAKAAAELELVVQAAARLTACATAAQAQVASLYGPANRAGVQAAVSDQHTPLGTFSAALADLYLAVWGRGKPDGHQLATTIVEADAGPVVAALAGHALDWVRQRDTPRQGELTLVRQHLSLLSPRQFVQPGGPKASALRGLKAEVSRCISRGVEPERIQAEFDRMCPGLELQVTRVPGSRLV